MGIVESLQLHERLDEIGLEAQRLGESLRGPHRLEIRLETFYRLVGPSLHQGNESEQPGATAADRKEVSALDERLLRLGVRFVQAAGQGIDESRVIREARKQLRDLRTAHPLATLLEI